MKIIMMNMVVNKIGIALIPLIMGSCLFAQHSDKGTVTLEAGLGGNGYKLQTSQGFGSSGAGSWDINVMAGIFTHDRLNFNIEFENHSYLHDQDTGQNVTKYLGAQRLGLGIRYALVDRPKYQLLLGGTVGGFQFGYEVSDSNSVANLGAQGIYQTYGFTNKFFFGETGRFGIYLKAGLVNNPMRMSYIEVNGEEHAVFQGIPIGEYRFTSTGYYLKFGFTINI